MTETIKCPECEESDPEHGRDCPECDGSGWMTPEQISAAVGEKLRAMGHEWDKIQTPVIDKSCTNSLAIMRGDHVSYPMLDPDAWGDTDTALRALEQIRLSGAGRYRISILSYGEDSRIYVNVTLLGGVVGNCFERIDGQLSHAICRAILATKETPAGG